MDNIISKFEYFLKTATSGMHDAKSEAENLLAKGKGKAPTIKKEIVNIDEPLQILN